jgi:hypothetical protein
MMLPDYNLVFMPTLDPKHRRNIRNEVQLAKKEPGIAIGPHVQNNCCLTGFNILSRDEVTVVENIPTTQMHTVNEVLNQSINIMQSLEFNTKQRS